MKVGKEWRIERKVGYPTIQALFTQGGLVWASSITGGTRESIRFYS